MEWWHHWHGWYSTTCTEAISTVHICCTLDSYVIALKIGFVGGPGLNWRYICSLFLVWCGCVRCVRKRTLKSVHYLFFVGVLFCWSVFEDFEILFPQINKSRILKSYYIFDLSYFQYCTESSKTKTTFINYVYQRYTPLDLTSNSLALPADAGINTQINTPFLIFLHTFFNRKKIKKVFFVRYDPR